MTLFQSLVYILNMDNKVPGLISVQESETLRASKYEHLKNKPEILHFDTISKKAKTTLYFSCL